MNDHANLNGGSARVALLSAAGLARAGHAVTVFAAVPGAGSGELAGARIVCTGQHDIASDPVRLRAVVQGLWNAPARLAMRRVLDGMDRRRTVVHLHGWTKALSSSVILEVVRRRFALVLTLHDYFVACPNGGFFDYPRLQACTLQPLGLRCVATNCDARSYPQKLWRVARQAVQQRAARFPAAVRDFITISDASERLLRPHLPAGARLHRVRNPVDVRRGPPADVRRNEGFVYVGRLSPEKGPLLLARAGLGIPAPLSFVGDGPLREAVVHHNPGAAMAGWLAPEQVRAAVHGARALVLPSLWHETQGLVVAEAAALGVPAIVPQDCAASESVEDGVTGLWFRRGDEADLRRQMLRLQQDAGFAAALGAAAFERFWRDPPALERHVEGLERVYAQMLQEQAAEQP